MRASWLMGVFLAWSVGTEALEKVVPQYPDARSIDRTELPRSEYRVITSAPKRINNAMRIEEQARFKAQGEQELLRLANGVAIEEVFRFYRDFFAAQGVVVYQCAQRNCGNSSYWANEEFNDRRLYGRDSDQYYLVGRIDEGKQQRWIQIYIVMNGRKDAFVYQRRLQAESELSRADLMSGLVLGAEEVVDDTLAAAMAKILIAEPERVLWVVSAQAYKASVTLDTARSQGQKAGEVLADLIAQKTGVDRDRFQLEVRGDLSQRPLGISADRWFELYLR